MAGAEFPGDNPDWTHSNTVQVLPETPASRDPRFKPGNVMVSHRNLDTALVIERETGEDPVGDIQRAVDFLRTL